MLKVLEFQFDFALLIISIEKENILSDENIVTKMY